MPEDDSVVGDNSFVGNGSVVAEDEKVFKNLLKVYTALCRFGLAQFSKI